MGRAGYTPADPDRLKMDSAARTDEAFGLAGRIDSAARTDESFGLAGR